MEIMLGQLLVKNRMITEEQLDSALEIQKKTNLKLGEILVNQGIITEKEIKDFLSVQRINFFY